MSLEDEIMDKLCHYICSEGQNKTCNNMKNCIYENQSEIDHIKQLCFKHERKRILEEIEKKKFIDDEYSGFQIVRVNAIRKLLQEGE